MPPAGYPAFLQYLQSGRVREFGINRMSTVVRWGRSNRSDTLYPSRVAFRDSRHLDQLKVASERGRTWSCQHSL